MDDTMKMEGEMPASNALPPQSRFSVAASVQAAPPPVEVEPIAEDELQLEEQRIDRQTKKRERDLKKLQEAAGKGAQKKNKRQREHQEGPASQQGRQLVQQLSNLLDKKQKLSADHDHLVKRLMDVGVDTELDVERLQSKNAMIEQVVRRAEAE